MPELNCKVVCDHPTAIGLGGQTALEMGFTEGNRHVVVDQEEPDGWFSAAISQEEARLLQDTLDQTGATHFRVEGLTAPAEASAPKGAAKKTAPSDQPVAEEVK